MRESNRSGVTTSLVVHGTRPQAVPPGVDLCAFRIVQEALTNVVKHAPGAHADVVIQWRPDSIAIDVDDNGHGQALLGRSWDGHSGHGLLGMSERVAMFGGELSAGPRARAEGSRCMPTSRSKRLERRRVRVGQRDSPELTAIEPEPAT